MAKSTKISIKSRWGLRRLMPRSEKLSNIQWMLVSEDFSRKQMATQISLSDRTAPFTATSLKIGKKEVSAIKLSQNADAFLPFHASDKNSGKTQTLHLNLTRLTYIDPQKGRAHFTSTFQPSAKWKILKDEKQLEATGLTRFTCASGKKVYVNPWAVEEIRRDNPFRRAAKWVGQRIGMKTGDEILKITLKKGTTFRVRNEGSLYAAGNATPIKAMKSEAKEKLGAYKEDFFRDYRKHGCAIHRAANPLHYLQLSPI